MTDKEKLLEYVSGLDEPQCSVLLRFVTHIVWEGYNYIRVAEVEYRKAITQFRLQLGGLLGVLRMYGQGAYVDGLIPVIVILAEQLTMRLRGKTNQAIYVEPPYRADD